jgi:uncharacterized protein (TIGR02453 family)
VITPTINKSTFSFLRQLAANNNRDWFNEHKAQYELAKQNAEGFMDGLIAKMNRHDQLETSTGKKSLFRIYNDVRFAKDKSPYNPRFSGYLRRVKPYLRGGYFIMIKPGASRVRCGFTGPNPDDLRRMRHDISSNHDYWKKLLKSKSITANFGVMKGEQVRTAPRGFSMEDPAIELLRYKQFMFERYFTDKEVLTAGFLTQIDKTFKSIRPFFDYASEVLTTDVNGVSLIAN